MKKWYAVQHGDDYDCGYGSTVKREAIKMANAMKRNPYYDDEEIRIAITDADGDDFVYEVIVIREGGNGGNWYDSEF